VPSSRELSRVDGNARGVWLPDGSGLITTMGDVSADSSRQIGLISNGGRGPLVPLIATQFQNQYPAVSPDGKWVAFVSDQTGVDEVYVSPIRGDGDVVQVSQHGGIEPVWAPDGRELFYRSGREASVDLMSATVTFAPTF
jgi:Tol biopolymer transport system component